MAEIKLEEIAAIFEGRANESEDRYLDADSRSNFMYYLGLCRGYRACEEILRAYINATE